METDIQLPKIDWKNIFAIIGFTAILFSVVGISVLSNSQNSDIRSRASEMTMNRPVTPTCIPGDPCNFPLPTDIIPSPTSNPLCRADLNGDGQLNSADLAVYTSEQGVNCRNQSCVSDANCDGVVTIMDYRLLNMHSAMRSGAKCPGVIPAACSYPSSAPWPSTTLVPTFTPSPAYCLPEGATCVTSSDCCFNRCVYAASKGICQGN